MIEKMVRDLIAKMDADKAYRDDVAEALAYAHAEEMRDMDIEDLRKMALEGLRGFDDMTTPELTQHIQVSWGCEDNTGITIIEHANELIENMGMTGDGK